MQNYQSPLPKFIEQKEAISYLPHIQCPVSGHEANELSHICCNQDCQFRGLTCYRCIYQSHATHASECFPLNEFLSTILEQSGEFKGMLTNRKEELNNLQNNLINEVKNFVIQIIEHFAFYVSAMTRTFQIINNKLDENTLTTDTILHSIHYKKHISRDHWLKFIKTVNISQPAGSVKPDIQFNDFTTTILQSQNNIIKYREKLQQLKSNLQPLFRQVQNGIPLEQFQGFNMDLLKDNSVVSQVKEFSRKLMENLGIPPNIITPIIPNKTNNNNYKNLSESINFQQSKENDFYNNASFTNIPNMSLEQSNKAFKFRFPNVKPFSATEQTQSGQLNKFLQGLSQELSYKPLGTEAAIFEYNTSSYISNNRKKCSLNLIASKIVSASFKCTQNLQTSLQSLTCLSVINHNYIAACGRYDSQIEIYFIKNNAKVQKIETNYKEGIKTLLIMKKANTVNDYYLIAGTYANEPYIKM